MHDRDVVRAQPANVLLELAGPGLVHLDGHDLAGEHRRLAARSGAEVEHPFARKGPDANAGELRAAALGPDLALFQGFFVHPRDLPGVRNVRFGPVWGLSPDMSDNDRGRLVLRPHQGEGVLLAEVALPELPDPIRVGVLERAFRERGEERLDPIREPPEHRVREGDRPLEPRRAHEFDRLVHSGVARHAVQVAELERAEAERRQHRRVQLAHRPLAERLDRMVERPLPLDRAEGELPRERAVAVVEVGRGTAQRPVGVRPLLGDADEHVVGRLPRGRDFHRRPRTKAS